MKVHSAAANGLATGAFQKCNWGHIYPMVDRGLNKKLSRSKLSGSYPIYNLPLNTTTLKPDLILALQ